MDFAWTKLFDYGLGAAALFLFARFHWHLIKTTIPSMLADFRGEMAAQRAEGKADRDQHERHMEALIGRMDAIEGDMEDIKVALGTSGPSLRIFNPGDNPGEK